MVFPDRPRGDAHMSGQLTDSDHSPMMPLDVVPGATLQTGFMGDLHFDRQTLRDLADDGNEAALDRLADLAAADGDLAELSDLWTRTACMLDTCSPSEQSHL